MFERDVIFANVKHHLKILDIKKVTLIRCTLLALDLLEEEDWAVFGVLSLAGVNVSFIGVVSMIHTTYVNVKVAVKRRNGYIPLKCTIPVSSGVKIQSEETLRKSELHSCKAIST